MIIVPVPRRFIRSTSWAQSDQRKQLQRSEWTGRTREMAIGPADRWTCQADVRPTRPGDIETWRAFQARMKQPGAAARMPVDVRSQYGAADNLIQNPDFMGSPAPWALESGWSWIETGAPPDLPSMGLYTDSTRAFSNAFANAGAAVPILAFQALFLSCDVFRSTGSTGQLNMTANFLNSGGGLISSLGMNLVAVATANLWQRARVNLVAPAGTASAVVCFNNGLTAGSASVSGARASLWPERALVATGSSPLLLNLYSLPGPPLHLVAGQMLSVPLPGGDEQLVMLTEDLVASVNATATARLASPLRQIPAADTPVELARPWALMRATDPLAWSQSPGALFAAGGLQMEEWF